MNTFDPKNIFSDREKLFRLKNKKLFLFDIDGTIAVGDTLYDGSADLIRYINDIGGNILGAAPGSVDRALAVQILRDNPLGQSHEQTPMGIIRPVEA